MPKILDSNNPYSECPPFFHRRPPSRPGRGHAGRGGKKEWNAPCSTVACALQHCGMRLAALCHAPCSTVACALQSYFARSMTQMCMEHDTYALLSCDSSTGCRLVPRRAADPVEILDSDSPNSPSWLRPLTSPGLRAVGMLPAGLWHAPCRTILHGACHSPAWGMPHTVPHRCARSMPQVYSEHGRGALLSLYSCTVCSLVPGREADPRENLGSDYPNSPSWECPLSFC